MHSTTSLESLSTAYFTAESHSIPASLESPCGIAGSFFQTSHNNGGKVINVAGDYYFTTEGPPVTHPPSRANHAPTGAITRHFVGRTNELEQIYRAFNVPRTINRPVRYALSGTAGIGKTQLAFQYAERAYAQERYSHIFYISASSVHRIRKGLKYVLCSVQPSDYVCPKSLRTHEARRWLENEHLDIKWLLIVDSAVAQTVNYLRSHLPRTNLHGDVLIAAQSGAVTEALVDEGHGVVLEVGPLAVDDAVQLLFKRAGVKERHGQIEEARAIVEWLDLLPIAIHQAASFAKHFHSDLRCLARLRRKGRWSEVRLIF